MSHGTTTNVGDMQTTAMSIFGTGIQVSGSSDPVDTERLTQFYKHGGTHSTTGVNHLFFLKEVPL